MIFKGKIDLTFFASICMTVILAGVTAYVVVFLIKP